VPDRRGIFNRFLKDIKRREQDSQHKDNFGPKSKDNPLPLFYDNIITQTSIKQEKTGYNTDLSCFKNPTYL